MTVRGADDPDVYPPSFDEQIHLFVDEHRGALLACLDGLSEEQARRQAVPSSTTLLGLVKHATFTERVWFEEAFTGASRSALGIEAGPNERELAQHCGHADILREQIFATAEVPSVPGPGGPFN